MHRTVLSILILLLCGTMVSAQSGRLQIVATHTILADVVQNVAGDVADVSSLMPAGADPHSFQPAPQDLARLADADVIFVNGAGFEEGLLEAIENAGEDLNIVTASECVEILPFGEHDHEEGDDEHAAAVVTGETSERCAANTAELEADPHHEGEDHMEHADEHLGPLFALECGGHDHEAEAEGEEHEHGGCDPHVWTDPHNVALWTLTARDTLSALDPANAETYAANAAGYLDALETLLHDELEPMIDGIPAENRVLVTNHETLGYFAHRFGFEIVGVVISGGSTLAEPSAGEMAALIDTIRGGGAAALFAENTVSPAVAQQIADETGAAFYTLYSDSLSESDGPAATYLDYMRYNVSTIVDALS